MTKSTQTHKCDACGKAVATTFGGTSLEYGWTLPINKFGGYAMFDDDIGPDTLYVSMCHDCVVVFLETFPSIAKIFSKFGTGMHPNVHWGPDSDGTRYPPCCKWAWCVKKIGNKHRQFNVSDDGKWVEVE